ncbi:hypothetical protein F4809DRAFT_564016 [Biscogniauxia mediterranea]|nr:hypothetical protein F4809DRAFT_564016 [Biscogniauxia mediterranea]
MAELPGPEPDPTRRSESWSQADDWMAMGNARERRRIQNRINQRARRSRQRRQASISVENHASYPYINRSHYSPSATSPLEAVSGYIAEVSRIVEALNFLDCGSERNQALIRAFEAFVHNHYLLHAPVPGLLPSLLQFNFTRALMSNAEVLGLGSGGLDDEAISPFHVAGPWPPSINLDPGSLPVGLRPTDLQRRTSHHPWFDLLPIPQMRDNLFRRGPDFFDDMELCRAMRGRAPYTGAGIIVWRDPWDASGWEVTEEFARSSWGWIIVGCWDLYRSTNVWRAQRGERPLFYCPDVS